MVSLKSSHLILEATLVKQIFNTIHYAYVAYVEEQQKILVTPVSSQWFVKMHKPTQFLLKEKNLNGDRSIAIREILIDYDLNDLDGSLTYEVVEKINLIKINLK